MIHTLSIFLRIMQNESICMTKQQRKTWPSSKMLPEKKINKTLNKMVSKISIMIVVLIILYP